MYLIENELWVHLGIMSTALKCCHNAGISIFDITRWKLLMFITRRKNWHNIVGIRYHKVVEHDSIWGDSLLEEAGLCWHGSGACVSSLSEVKKVQLVLLYPCCRKWASQNLSFSVDCYFWQPYCATNLKPGKQK